MPNPASRTRRYARPPACAGASEDPDQPPVEERAEPLGRVQEVQRRARGRGVDDDQVPATVPRRPAGDRLGASWPSFSIAMYSCVPAKRATTATGRRGSRGSAAARSGSACASTTSSKVRFMSSIIASSEPPARRRRSVTGRGVVVELGQTQRLGEPPGRVDGEDDDPPPALGRPQRERRGRRRLADAARAAADDDPGGRVVEERVDVEGRSERPRAAESAGTRGGTRLGAVREPRPLDGLTAAPSTRSSSSSYRPPRSIPSSSVRELVRPERRASVSTARSRSCRRWRPTCSRRLVEQRRAPRAVATARPARRRLRATAAARRGSVRRPRCSVVVAAARRDLVHDDARRPADRRRAARRPRRPSPGPASPRAASRGARRSAASASRS